MQSRPARSLIVCFVAWKLLLLLIAAGSPGPGYDTSTSLILPPPSSSNEDAPLPPALHYVLSKLTRWDAIYFVQAAHRGYRFEQEWAFGWGFSRLIAFVTAIVQKAGVPQYDGLESLVAICIALTAHLLSVLVLFSLTRAIFASPVNSVFPLTASLLHILSPAGLFLSAPYAESSCALLSFLGCLLFMKSRVSRGQHTAGDDLLVVAAGLTFGIAATFRSNLILNGLLLLEEALRTLYYLRYEFNLIKVRRLIATGLGGLLVGVGFVLPQYIAYREYCAPSNIQSRPWCERALPSIYVFVQSYYWNVGPFRYWTLSNVPLFLLATPMLAIMVVSGAWALDYKRIHTTEGTKVKKHSPTARDAEADNFYIFRNLAVAQLLLALLTFITAHVQIITRISSACPVWVWYLAMRSGKGDSALAKNALRFMVMYSMIQGVLFSSFLPPA